MLTVEDMRNLKVFPVVVESDCPLIFRIHPLKQKQVAELYNFVKSNNSIKRVFIFGSSTSNKCNIDSDLDVCLDLNIPMEPCPELTDISRGLSDLLHCNYDKLYYSDLDDKLRKIIDEEGVLIYEQFA